MANREHLKILKQGVDSWNKWVEENPEVRPDFEGAKFRGADLAWADLSWANLRGADLRRVNLDFADLRGANLEGVNLRKAHLEGANFKGAKLEGACLDANWFPEWVKKGLDANGVYSGARLVESVKAGFKKLRGAHLEGAHLTGADLVWADLCEAYLGKADLRWAKLQAANLRKANLEEAKLGEADLRGADLGGAHLGGADLEGANLSRSDIRNACLNDAETTGVRLYLTARKGWKIDNIKCDYVYWDEYGNIRTPKNRNFRPGEFEELYKELPTFEYYFEHGFTPIDAVVMDQVVQAVNEQNPEFKLKLTTLDSRGQPHAIFSVLHKKHVKRVQKKVGELYERIIMNLENERDFLRNLLRQVVKEPKILAVIGDLIDKNAGGV